MESTLRLAIKADKARTGARVYNQATDSVVRGSKRADRALVSTSAKMKGLGATAASVKGLIGGMFAGVGGAMIARSAIKSIASFEQTMQTIKGVTGETGAAFDALRDKARDLGAATRFSATEAGEGLLFLSRAGFSTTESLAAVEATLQLAQSGSLGLGEAADYASNIVSGFGMKASETVKVVDILVKTSNSANTNVTQMAEAMKFAAPVAGALGHDIEEAAAAIGVLGDSGIQGSMAGTQLRGAMVKLLKPSGEAAKALKEMGLTVQDVNPEMHSITDIFGKFADANITAEQATKIFMARNVSGALVLTKNIEKLKELTEKNRDAAGTAKEMADIMDDSLIGSFKGLLSAVTELFLKMGDSGFTGVLRTVIDTLRDAFRILGGMQETVTKNRKAAFLLAGTLKWLGIVMGTIIALKFGNMLVGILVSVAALPAKIVALTLSLTPLLTATLSLGVAMASLGFGRKLFDEFRLFQDMGSGVIKQMDLMTWGLKVAADDIPATLDLLSARIQNFFAQHQDTMRAPMALMSHMPGPQGAAAGAVLSAINNGAISKSEAAAELAVQEGKLAARIAGGGVMGRASELENIYLTRQKDLQDIEDLFGNSETRDSGMSFTDGVVDSLNLMLDQVNTVTDSIAESLRGAFTSPETEEDLEEELARRKKAIEDVLASIDAEINGVEENAEGLTAELVASAEKAQELESLGDTFVQQGRTLFDDLTNGADNFGESLLRMVQNISSAIFEMQFLQKASDWFTQGFSSGEGNGNLFASIGAAIGSAFGGGQSPLAGEPGSNLMGPPSSLAGAFGGVFDGGGFGQRLARGSVFTSPTARRMAGGGVAAIGEAGPEGLFPLTKDSKGNLAVRGEGGGARTINQHITIVTPDANSFRRSQRQIARDMNRMTRGLPE
jgi:TP901 family phage tail tape measure protein